MGSLLALLPHTVSSCLGLGQPLAKAFALLSPSLHVSSFLPSPPTSPLSPYCDILILSLIKTLLQGRLSGWIGVQWSPEVSWEEGALKWGPEGRVKGAARWPGDVREGVSVSSDLG